MSCERCNTVHQNGNGVSITTTVRFDAEPTITTAFIACPCECHDLCDCDTGACDCE